MKFGDTGTIKSYDWHDKVPGRGRPPGAIVLLKFKDAVIEWFTRVSPHSIPKFENYFSIRAEPAFLSIPVKSKTIFKYFDTPGKGRRWVYEKEKEHKSQEKHIRTGAPNSVIVID
ncbi:MAG TPA: hypothetical protein HA232_00480 [Methanocellales archaeon]|nr:hypothetical protein [Methanocellales archaeon]